MKNVLLLVFVAFPRLVHSQETTAPPPFSEPPKLTAKLSDDFEVDSRERYQGQGPVSWTRGSVSLAHGARMSLPVSGVDWTEVSCQWEFPTEEDGHLDLMIRFDFEGYPSKSLLIQQIDAGGAWHSRLQLHHHVGGEDREPEVIRSRDYESPLPSGQWTITYRYGLWRIESPAGTHDFVAYLEETQNLIAIRRVQLISDGRVARLLNVDIQSMALLELDSDSETLKRAKQKHDESVRQYQAGQIQESIRTARESIELLETSVGHYHPDTATIISNAGVFCKTVGRFSEAEKFFLKARQIREELVGTDHPEYLIMGVQFGQLYLEIAKYEEAEKELQDAHDQLARVLGDYAAEVIGVKNDLSVLYLYTGDTHKGERFLREAMHAAEALIGRENNDYATMLHNLAALHMSRGEYDESIKLFREVLSLRRSLSGDEHPHTAHVMMFLGMAHYISGQTAESLLQLEQAKTIFESTIGKQTPQYAQTIAELANVYAEIGDVTAAAPLYLESREIRRQIIGEFHPLYALQLSNMAVFFDRIGDKVQSEQLLNEARYLYENILGKDSVEYGITLSLLGNLYGEQGHFRKAEDTMQNAKRIIESTVGAKHEDYGVILANLSNLYRSQGRYDDALPLLISAQQVVKASLGTDHHLYGQVMFSVARLHQRLSQLDAAEPAFLATIENTQVQIQMLSSVMSEQKQRQLLAAKRGGLSGYFNLAFQMTGMEKRCYDQWLGWKGAALVRQSRNRRLSSDPKISQSFGELSRLTSSLSHLINEAPVHPSNSDVEKEQRLYELKKKNWQSEINRLQARKTEIERTLASVSREYQRLVTPTTVEDLLQQMPEDVAIVDYFTFQHATPNAHRPGEWDSANHYGVFVIRSGRPVRMIDLGPSDAIDEAINHWRTNLLETTVKKPATDRSDRAPFLRKHIWEPAERHLDGTRQVLVSPDGELGKLPFNALPGKHPGSYLIEDHALAFIPVPSLLLASDDEDSEFRDDPFSVLVVGNVDYDAESDSSSTVTSEFEKREPEALQRSWPALPATIKEIDSIHSLFRKQNGVTTTRLEKQRASKKAFLEALPRHNIIHVATHGYFSPKQVHDVAQSSAAHGHAALDGEYQFELMSLSPGLETGLVLAGANEASTTGDDGIVTAEEIAFSNLSHVNTVVLSACETGLGQVAYGEGLMSLKRAFQIAGAKSTVTSLWKVNDHATQRLMVRFYHNWTQSGMNQSQALREAQLWMLRNPVAIRDVTRGDPVDLPFVQVTETVEADRISDEYRTHPRYWAAWVLSGDWR